MLVYPSDLHGDPECEGHRQESLVFVTAGQLHRHLKRNIAPKKGQAWASLAIYVMHVKSGKLVARDLFSGCVLPEHLSELVVALDVESKNSSRLNSHSLFRRLYGIFCAGTFVRSGSHHLVPEAHILVVVTALASHLP